MKNQIRNPYLPLYEYIPDGEPHVFDGRLYVYGSHDQFGAFSFCHNDYVTWSAPLDDLSDWRYEGVILKKDEDPDGKSGRKNLYAPDVVRGNDGRYYIYYAYDFLGKIGVAVSDSPKGEFKFLGHVRYSDRKELGKGRDTFWFDPGVINDDGHIYLYAGFGPASFFPQIRPGLKADGGYVMELEDDMITVKEGPKKIFEKKGHADPSFEGHEFFEASSIRKINGIYYFIYSSIEGHELCYATSSSPWGPFKFGGTIISNGDVGLDGRTKKAACYPLGNNHGSIADVNGKYYIFYHRHTNYTNTDRQGLAEPVEILEDGSIPQVETTSQGLNGKPLDGKGIYPASICCCLMPEKGNVFYPFMKMPHQKGETYITQYGKDSDTEETQYIANVKDGCLIGYKYFDLSKTNKVAISLKGKGSGKIFVRYSENGENRESAKFSSSKKEMTKVTIPLNVRKEKVSLYFYFEIKGKLDVYSIEFE